MIVDDFIIEVRDANYIRQGQLIDADLTNFLAVPRANNIGSWQVVLPQNVLAEDGTETPHRMCELLRTPGSGVVVTNSRTGLVEISGPLDNAEHDANTSDPGGTWTLTGLSDTTILAEAEAWPDPTDPDPANQDVANDIRVAPAETLIHEFVDANIGPSATTERQNPRLTMGPNLGRGPSQTKSPRFTNLLTLCQSIATGTTLLFDVAQVGDQLELRTWEAEDLTDDIRMDLANGQLSSVNYAYSRPTLTHVTVLGQGEGVDRQIVSRTSTEALAAASLWGIRIERSLDQRHTDVVEELEQAGDEALAEEGTTITSLRVAPSGDQTDNFGVGDFVTVVVGGQEVPAQVTEMPISITADGVFVGCTVGDPNGFDWESLLVARQSRQEKRLARIERSAEVPASLYSQEQVNDLVAAARDVAARVARNRNPVVNGNFRTNQRGYVSGVSLGPRSYGFDMWQCAGITNLITNPSAETNTTSWAATACTLARVNTWARSGSWSFGLSSPTLVDSYMQFSLTTVAGRRYTVSGYARVGATALSGSEIALRARALFVFDAGAGTPTLATSLQATNAANTVTRVSTSFIAIGTTTNIRAYIGHTAGSLWWDDIMVTEGSTLWPYHDGGSADSAWTATAHASTSRRGPASGAAAFTADPHGQTLTLADGNGLMQIIDRANIPAGDRILSLDGTIAARAYNVGTAPSALPAFATSGTVYAMDGLDDVVLEVRAIGGSKTVGKLQFEAGTAQTPFEEIPSAQELALCRMEYRRFSTTGVGAQSVVQGFAPTATDHHFVLPFPMRAHPEIAWNNMQFSDNNGYATAIVRLFADPASSPEALMLRGTNASTGVVRCPAVIRASTSGPGWLELACNR